MILVLFFAYEMAVSLQANHLVVAGIFAVLTLLPLILLPPGMAGLWNVANRITDGLAIHWSDYFEGARRYFWKSLGLALINILVLAILLSNVWFYVPSNNPFNLGTTASLVIQFIFLLLTASWLVYQMYPLAMLLEQTDKSIRVALRNAGILFIIRPGFSFLLALILALAIGISTYPLVIPWFVVTLSLIAVVCSKATKHLLIPHREKAKQEAAAEAEAESETSVEE
jgi:hypothetical protein